MKNWEPPRHWQKITTLDTHTAGEPFRVITGGLPDIPGDTILKKRRYLQENLDHVRKVLMWEPRGHADMYGCIVTPPVSAAADFGVLFMHNAGYSTMCGHGIIGIATVAVETGWVPMTEPETVIKIDSPAGLVTAHARIQDKKVQSVYFHNVPSFVLALDEVITVPDIGPVRYDVAFGGAFYAFVQAEEIGITCAPEDFAALVAKGKAIKRALLAGRTFPHPFEKDLSFLYGTIFIGRSQSKEAHSRHVCIFAEGEVDRSPTGTGVSARLAICSARKEIETHQTLLIESIIGSRFSGKIVEKTTYGPHAAVIPEVEGSAYMTGRNEFFIDPDDPLRNGFILR